MDFAYWRNRSSNIFEENHTMILYRLCEANQMIDKPKILFIASNIPTPKRKANKVVLTLAHRLSAFFGVSVLHPTEIAPFPISLLKKYKNISVGSSWNDDGIAITPFKYVRLPNIKFSFLLLPLYRRKIKKHLKTLEQYAVTHAHYVMPDGYFAYQIKALGKTPYFVSFRQSDEKYMRQLDSKSKVFGMYMDVLQNADHIFVHNQCHKEYLLQFGIQSQLIGHGIETDFLEEKGTDTTQKQEIDIASIGELIPLKHIDWVINAVQSYKGEKKVHLYIAGEGPLRHELETISDPETTTFTGQIDRNGVSSLLSKTDIFALPSKPETFGLVYIEAGAKSNAVIARKDAGIWGHFADTEDVLFCDDYNSFESQLHKLIDDDALRHKLSRALHEKIASRFTWDEITAQYKEQYDLSLKK